MNELDAPDGGHFIESAGDMTDTDRAVLRRAGLAPLVDEAARADREFMAAVGIAGLKNRAGDGFDLRDQQLELALAVRDD